MGDKTLLPCPFCGGEAYTTDSDNKWFVSCHDCYACVGEGYDADAWPDHMFYSKAEAIAAWNTRAPQATRIEALEAALRETMSRCADCGGRGSFVKHDEVTDRDLWESCASCAVGYAALEGSGNG